MEKCVHHHLIYGSLEDCLTGQILQDTDDERIRQSLFQMMMVEKGYSPQELRARVCIETEFKHHRVVSMIDLVVSVSGKEFMVLRYGPGSLTSRHRSAIAAARIIRDDYQLPFAVVTNGKDAEVLDTISGNVLGDGVDFIPSALWAAEHFEQFVFRDPPVGKQKEYERRILNAFDVDGCCL